MTRGCPGCAFGGGGMGAEMLEGLKGEQEGEGEV